MSQRMLARQETESRILLSALRLFSREGYSATSMRAIAKEAGISLGLTYNYFSSKDQLLKAIVQQCLQEIQESMQPGPQEELTLETLMVNMLEVVQKNLEFWRLFHHLRLQQSIMENLLPEARAIQGYVMQQLQQLPEIKNTASPEGEARMLFAALDGIINHSLIMPDYPAAQMMKLLHQKYT